jgi:hypothetical protein
VFELDIYLEAPGGDDDVYLQRRWHVLPEHGDTIAYEDNKGVTVQGTVVRRLFVTDGDGSLRVQLHCTLLVESATVADTL